MATPIKDTPILIGKDARRFERIIKENETKRVSAEEYSRIQEAGKKIRIFNSMKDYQDYRDNQAGL